MWLGEGDVVVLRGVGDKVVGYLLNCDQKIVETKGGHEGYS